MGVGMAALHTHAFLLLKPHRLFFRFTGLVSLGLSLHMIPLLSLVQALRGAHSQPGLMGSGAVTALKHTLLIPRFPLTLGTGNKRAAFTDVRTISPSPSIYPASLGD